ncbi:MAG: PspC domain-containing protein [Streptococcaceae bacterium]|jgi:phage shock protein PspC (stress-responsive transcriptional regulator)|nr:PspC domain-containing protein [Streptococcaceae bacterium]
MKKRLTKSRENVVIGGVIGGFGEYFGIDPTILRIVYVTFAILGWGSPILLYIILLFIVPEGEKKEKRQEYGFQNRKGEADSRKDVTDSVKEDKDVWSDF